MPIVIKKILRADCAEFILNIHYAKRWPSVSYAFGIFEGDVLLGVITYGTPLSCTLRRGIAGDEYADSVIELNRLVLSDNIHNHASQLIGGSLKLLPKNKVVVSFADTSQGHRGIVYQATNFLYCGLSAKRTDWTIRGKEHLHGQTISDQFRGVKNRAQALRDKYGDDFYLRPRPRKHRYITTTGSKTFRRHFMRALKYAPQPYP